MCGFIAQLVEHRTGIAEVMGSNPVEALIFFRLLLSNCLNWKIYCDDHTSLSNLMFFSSNFLFQDLIAKLVFKRPEKPIDFLVKEMEEVKRNQWNRKEQRKQTNLMTKYL